MGELRAGFNDDGKWKMIRVDDVLLWAEETRKRMTWICADPASPLTHADH
jgi:hypothetical protein